MQNILLEVHNFLFLLVSGVKTNRSALFWLVFCRLKPNKLVAKTLVQNPWKLRGQYFYLCFIQDEKVNHLPNSKPVTSGILETEMFSPHLRVFKVSPGMGISPFPWAASSRA